MKLILLTAFSGRLKGEVMEWPDWPPQIILPFDISPTGGFSIGKDVDLGSLLSVRKAIFEPTNRYEIYNGQYVHIYCLTGV